MVRMDVSREDVLVICTLHQVPMECCRLSDLDQADSVEMDEMKMHHV